MTIAKISEGIDVSRLVEQIDSTPSVWNRHRERTQSYESPHNAISDIWVRYNDIANLSGGMEAFNGEHESVWYDVLNDIPAVNEIVNHVFDLVGGKQLGGVLITKVPPGEMVAPHIDSGWHAGHYEKFAVQLKGSKDQAFCFEGCELRPEPGDLYTFDNSKLHWVINESDSDRMTLIICIKR